LQSGCVVQAFIIARALAIFPERQTMISYILSGTVVTPGSSWRRCP
jgi:hypothetical protein